VSATVVGISADKPATQLKFVEKFELTFPMIADTGKEIIDAYGAREVLGVTAKRRTFLIGPDGTIVRIWLNVKVEGHAEEVLAAIR
jgi:peroxiredoxin Q/BCP